MKEEFYAMCVKEAKRAFLKNEVPIGAVIYNKKNKKKFKSYNRTNKTKQPLMHAEIIVIKKMAKHLKSWRLDDCELYVTIEPCNMCKAIIAESRISKVYYGFESTYYKNKQTKQINYINLGRLENKEIMCRFFKEKR